MWGRWAVNQLESNMVCWSSVMIVCSPGVWSSMSRRPGLVQSEAKSPLNSAWRCIAKIFRTTDTGGFFFFLACSATPCKLFSTSVVSFSFLVLSFFFPSSFFLFVKFTFLHYKDYEGLCLMERKLSHCLSPG